ncbi:MAG TPA: hypothetical protein VEO95_08835 [Chthoniobacteraceae bacterium]|nr:hypothetical protein [Chthoniobacteraceae bacterium]
MPEAIEIVVVESLSERRVRKQFVPPAEDFASLGFGDFRPIASLGREKLAPVFIEPLDEAHTLGGREFQHGRFDFSESAHGTAL